MCHEYMRCHAMSPSVSYCDQTPCELLLRLYIVITHAAAIYSRRVIYCDHTCLLPFTHDVLQLCGHECDHTSHARYRGHSYVVVLDIVITHASRLRSNRVTSMKGSMYNLSAPGAWQHWGWWDEEWWILVTVADCIAFNRGQPFWLCESEFQRICRTEPESEPEPDDAWWY
jgi:hypothetical protein